MIYKNQNITHGYRKDTYIDFYNSKYSFIKNSNIDLDILSAQHQLKISNDKYLSWNLPSIITNCVITISHLNNLYIEKNLITIYEFCSRIVCKHIVLKIEGDFPISALEPLLNNLEHWNIHSVVILCDFYDQYFTDEFGEVIMNLQLNKKLIVLNSPFEKNFEDTMFFTKKMNMGGYNKYIHEFRANITLYSESQSHNTYFNRKLFIGLLGEIKNAPECEDIYGYIQDLHSPEELKEIISTPTFQKYWFVHKELIDVCKDCEFRHMCVDNRVPVERSESEWFHTLECNYNPYICKWEGEEGYLTLSECGIISDENGFSINHDKITEINANLWAEE